MFHQAPSVASSSSSLRNLRRRSADVGGLHLAMMNGGGQGWLGVDGELETQYAESLSDMYNQTREAVKEHGEHFILPDLSPADRQRLIHTLDKWHFEPHALKEWEKFACCMILFEGLYLIEGMEEAICVPFHRIPRFLHELRQIYRLENSYHNFEHALDVLQASYQYLYKSGMIPSVTLLLQPNRSWKPEKKPDSHIMSTLGPVELFVIYLAAIGHDVGHPGLTNVFMKNASTPLSLVFDGKSALEQLHYQLLVRVMRQYGMEKLLDHPKHGYRARKLLYETILATDMSVHVPFMKKFEQVVEGEPASTELRQVLVCQAILKCADISNPSRPYRVSKHWAGALMEEWSSQATFEKHLHLPTSVQSDGTAIGVAKSQVFFITHFASPLLDLTVRGVPEMQTFSRSCQGNLGAWKKRLSHLETSTGTASGMNTATSSPRPPDHFGSAFPMTLPSTHRTTSPQLEDILKWQQTTSPPAASTSYAASAISEATNGSGSADSASSTPSPSASTHSFIFSPSSDTSTYTFTTDARPPSSEGSTVGSLSSSQITVSSCQATIRAAGKAAIRKQKSMNRNSWSPLMSSSSNISAGNSAVTLVMQSNSAAPLTQQKNVAISSPLSSGGAAPTPLMMKPIKREQTASTEEAEEEPSPPPSPSPT